MPDAAEGPERDSFTPKVPWLVARPTRDAHYAVYSRAYAAALALRLTLPDAMQADWLAPALLSWIGVALLAVNGSFLGWLFAAVGTALPILLLEDQLSQSTYLLCCAIAALTCFRDRDRLAGGLQAAVRWLTAGVYALAALHKLNRDYFDPAVSCANEGLRVLAERSPGVIPDNLLATFEHPAWPVAHIGVEIVIAVLLLRRPRLGVALAAAMHVPLTIIFAPGFAFTMMSGWICFFSHDELAELWRWLKQHYGRVALVGGIPAAASRAFLFPGRWSSDPDWCIKEIVLWLVAATLLLTASNAAPTWRRRWPPAPAAVVVGAFLVNGLTPYVGLQFHHTAAMLSNLRIDEGCYNSFVFPETLRGEHDPYVRLDAIEFAAHRATPETRAAIQRRLWTLRALHQARYDWCYIHEEPLPARGTFEGQPFDTDDLCSEWPLPEPVLTGFRRFQVNLDRTCPQRCLH